ncbi:alpha-hydroxy-acid oxidizing protein [Gammaproteobacteria bacterium]|nr:alpha-hydroxy-acid oxidizing protein [Gammaproteobacteria bacterium]
MTPTDYSRRKLLQYLAGSPLLAASLGLPAIPSIAAQRLDDKDYIAESAQWAVNVFDMENVALRNWNQAHWTYISQGVDDELTLRANREGYERLHLRARRLIDVSTINRQTELFGHTLSSPIIMAPVGGLGMAHPDGDIEVARGARASGHKMIMSTAATFGIEDITEARGEPVWYQLYPTDVWEITQGILRRVEATGSDVLFLTTDIPARNQDRMRRFDRSSDNCSECHIPGSTFADKAMLQGLNAPGNIRSSNPAMDWDWVKRLRDSTDMKLVIKGLTQPEDARLALRAGVDGIHVSNHGGRGDESGFATIDSLPEVVDVVRGRIPVIVDGGIRRGTDVLKALALGADAVCVGRPYIWGLGAFGQEGVTKVMQILDSELEVAMTQAGTPTLADITAAAVR